MTKTFRDPIHGDISVGPIQLAVIDSDAFQRLRYIRQNGLLHLVFPGAVHTRFAHSIGTMHLAQRVFDRLFPQAQCIGEASIARSYVAVVFELAALLHDIGHCAFSHSIERVDSTTPGPKIFRPIEELVSRWSTPENGLAPWWSKLYPAANASEKKSGRKWLAEPQHEELGILLAFMALNNPSRLFLDRKGSQAKRAFDEVFKGATLSAMTLTFSHMVDDVLAIMRDETDWLAPSDQLSSALSLLTSATTLPAGQDSKTAPEEAFHILHGLISGTLDVDRMDYLLRDSMFTGTVIGQFDLDLLINNLSLRHDATENKIFLCISERAKSAIDDFLWSRWQLYLQIINHKANVMLNALFPRAFRAAIRITELDYFEEMLLFTDDEVMTRVRRLFLDSSKGADEALRPAKLAFLRAQLPMHLHIEDLNDMDHETEMLHIADKRRSIAQSLGVPPSDIEIEITSSDLVKDITQLPRVVRKGVNAHGNLDHQLHAPDYLASRWAKSGRPMRVRRAHFFIERAPINPSGVTASAKDKSTEPPSTPQQRSSVQSKRSRRQTKQKAAPRSMGTQ